MTQDQKVAMNRLFLPNHHINDQRHLCPLCKIRRRAQKHMLCTVCDEEYNEPTD